MDQGYPVPAAVPGSVPTGYPPRYNPLKHAILLNTVLCLPYCSQVYIVHIYLTYEILGFLKVILLHKVQNIKYWILK